MRKLAVVLTALASVLTAVPCLGAQPVPVEKPVTSATADLNGDGKKEAIRLKVDRERGNYELRIGTAKIAGNLDPYIEGFQIVDVDRHDRYREVEVSTCGRSDDFASNLYWYDGKRITRMAALGGSARFHGNGDVTVSDRGDFWSSPTLYRLDRASHKLKEIPQAAQYVGVRAAASKPLTLYAQQNTKQVVVTLPKGSWVTLLLLSKGRFLVKTHSNLLGWIPDASNETFSNLPYAD